MKYTIYTDGGASPNPGPGGWGAVILGSPDADKPLHELSGAEAESTNNRMEITAAIEALRALHEPSEVTLVTDSTYLKSGTAWVRGWRENGWLTKEREPVKNRDLWEALDEQISRHEVEWQWTKGHAGDRWNERADELASKEIPRPTLPLDDHDSVHLFTAASYSSATRCGGWGVVLRYREHSKELSGGDRDSTSNRMQIQSAIEAIIALNRKLPVHLYTTSDYTRDGATRWIPGWRQRGWFTRENKPVSHRDLWQALDEAQQDHAIEWHVVAKADEVPADMARAKEIAKEAMTAAAGPS